MSAAKKARKVAGVRGLRGAGKGSAGEGSARAVRAPRAGRAQERGEASSGYAEAYRGIDFRRYPELYRVGRGEQGVLIAEPYKSELLPLWRFKSEALARVSAAALWRAFVGYRRARDFVGMDMARKFLQMGFTRARRYANHRSGRKYAAARGAGARALLPRVVDEEKARAAAVFYEQWQRVEQDRVYVAWRRRVAAQGSTHAGKATLSRSGAARARR